jgi:hypothetical protein
LSGKREEIEPEPAICHCHVLSPPSVSTPKADSRVAAQKLPVLVKLGKFRGLDSVGENDVQDDLLGVAAECAN